MKNSVAYTNHLGKHCRIFTAFITAMLFNSVCCAQGLSFSYNERYDSLRILITGDITQSGSQITHAFDPQSRSYRYDSCLFYIQPLLALGDLVIGNLETTFSGPAYSGMPYYSAPDELAKSLKLSGYNILMTANDHCNDRGPEGLKRTLMVLDENKIAHTGTFASKEERSQKFPLLIEKYGFKIALLNYTATLRQAEKGNVVVNRIDKEQIELDMQRLLEYGPDYTIVYFHWGTQYQRFPNLDQKELAQMCFDLGADLVVGSNPHVLQRIEELEYVSKGVLKKGLVAYSMGNFLSDYDRRFGDGSAVLEVVLAKDKVNKVCSMAEYGFVPTYVSKDNQSGKKVTQIVPVSDIERGNITVPMSLREFELMKISGRDTRLMLNAPNCLEIRYPINDNIVNDVMETIILTQAPVNKDRQGGEVMGVQWKNPAEVKKVDTITQMQVVKSNDSTVNLTAEKLVSQTAQSHPNSSLQATNANKNSSTTPEANSLTSSAKVGEQNKTKDASTNKKVDEVNATKGATSERIITESKNTKDTKEIIIAEKITSTKETKLDTLNFTNVSKVNKYDTLDYVKKTYRVDTLKSSIDLPEKKQSITYVSDTIKNRIVTIQTESQKVEKTYLGEAYAAVDTHKILVVEEKYTSADQIVEKLKEQYKGYQISYRVKFYDMKTKVEINTFYYKYLEGYEVVWSGSSWLYYLGNTNSFDSAKDICILLRSKGLKNVEIIPFIGNKILDWKIGF